MVITAILKGAPYSLHNRLEPARELAMFAESIGVVAKSRTIWRTACWRAAVLIAASLAVPKKRRVAKRRTALSSDLGQEK